MSFIELTKALPCTLEKPCQNNGACTDDMKGGYTCECPPDVKGVNCEIKPEGG